jgi:hypothetical protein
VIVRLGFTPTLIASAEPSTSTAVNASLDPSTAQTKSPQQIELRQLVRELKTTELEPVRRSEILERMQRLLARFSVDDN